MPRHLPTHALLIIAVATFLPIPSSSSPILPSLPLLSMAPRSSLSLSASARPLPTKGTKGKGRAMAQISGPEPGIVACAGSAIFLALGGALGCAPRIFAGLSTALVISGPIQILDIAIMENASGKRKMVDALKAGTDKFVHSPVGFLKSQETALVYCLFGATYATANLCKALAVPLVGTLAATTVANMGACFYKDSELARICGQGPRRAFPKMGFVNLAVRDMLSMSSTFTLPPVLAAVMKSAGMQAEVAANAAQVLCPVVGQTIQVPFHLTALSLYNHPEWTLSQRIESLKELYVPTLFARMARALPCYGAGGVLNTKLSGVALSLAGGK